MIFYEHGVQADYYRGVFVLGIVIGVLYRGDRRVRWTRQIWRIGGADLSPPRPPCYQDDLMAMVVPPSLSNGIVLLLPVLVANSRLSNKLFLL